MKMKKAENSSRLFIIKYLERSLVVFILNIAFE